MEMNGVVENDIIESINMKQITVQENLIDFNYKIEIAF